MDDTGLSTEQPGLRIWLLGAWHMERDDGSPIDLHALLHRSQAINLFQLVLLSPKRSVLRETLMEALWPEQSYEPGGSLDACKSELKRGLAQLCSSLPLLPRATGDPPRYRLGATQEQVWTDLDAALALIQRAVACTEMAAELALWEEAYRFLKRGELLVDWQTACWYQHRMVQRQRHQVITQRTRCVLRIADLLLASQQIERAHQELANAFEYDPAQEEVGFYLLQLLAQMGQPAVALSLYSRLEAALEAKGSCPGKETLQLVRQLRSTQVVRNLRVTSYERTDKGGSLEVISLPTRTLSPASLSSSLSSHQALQTVAPSGLFSLAVEICLLLLQQKSGSPQDLFLRLAQAIESDDFAVKRYSRRHAIALLAAFSTELLNLPSTKALAAEEVLAFCSAGMNACWQLFWEGAYREVDTSLSIALPRLIALAREHAPVQKRAAALLAQAYQIASLLVLEREDFGTALEHCRQAYNYGTLANDNNLQAAALIRQANVHFYRKRPLAILQTYQQALLLEHSLSPLLQARIYSGLSSAQAELEMKQEALRSAAHAHEHFPEYPEDDPAFAYTNTTRYILHFNDANNALHFHQPNEAVQAIAQAASFVTEEVSPRGMELQNYRILASIATNDRDQSASYFEHFVRSGITLDSGLHQQEAQRTYLHMVNQWPHEGNVLRLKNLFS